MVAKGSQVCVLGFLTGFFGWGSFGLTISAIPNFQWLASTAGLRSSLWNECAGSLCSFISSPTSWLMAVRAFSIMSLIVIFFGGSALTYSQCKNHQPSRRIASVLYFIGGIFGIIAMSVYTANTTASVNSGFWYYGAGFIMGWVACLVAMCAGAFSFSMYKQMEDGCPGDA